MRVAVELASAYISLIPSARGIRQQLGRELGTPLEAEGRSAGDRTARSFGERFTSGLADTAKRGAAILGGGLVIGAGFGIKVAADFEQTQIAFEGILGSGEAATAMLGDLRDFANRTPFEFTDLTKSSKQLLAVGFAAEDLIPTMGTLGDVAAGLGAGPAEIESVVRAIGQIKGKGKAASQELIQISEALPGFSAIGAIAEGLGVSVGDAFKLVEQGAVPADEAIGLILEGMQKFPGASGAMERQSKTLNGVISTFKDTLSTTAIDFITPYLPAISRGVQAFGSFIRDDAVPALDSFVSFIRENVVPVVETVVRIFDEEGFGGVLRHLGQQFREALPVVGAALLEVGDALVNWVATNAPIWGQKLLDLGKELVAWVGPQIPPLLAELGNLIGAIGGWILRDGVPALVQYTGNLAAKLVDWVATDAIPGLLRELPGLIADVGEWIITEGVPAFIEFGKSLGSAVIEGLMDSLGDVPDALDVINAVLGDGRDDLPDRVRDELEGRADGGRVRAGQPYVVGERRPELFVPDSSGTILPSVPLGGGPLVGSLQVLQVPGEDSVTTAFRELNRVKLLAGAP